MAIKFERIMSIFKGGVLFEAPGVVYIVYHGNLQLSFVGVCNLYP